MSTHGGECKIPFQTKGVFPTRFVRLPWVKSTTLTKVSGIPSPDFPGGVGESNHVGVSRAADVAKLGAEGLRAMGLERWDSEADGYTAGEKEVMRQANKILGFD